MNVYTLHSTISIFLIEHAKLEYSTLNIGGFHSLVIMNVCIYLSVSDTVSARIECMVSPLDEMYKNTLVGNMDSVSDDLERTLTFLEDFISSGRKGYILLCLCLCVCGAERIYACFINVTLQSI